MADLISNRFLNDGIAEWEMTPVRLKYRRQLLEKIAQGTYRTENVEGCLCGSRSFERLSEKDRFGLPFGTSICRDCGLIVTTPRLAPETLPSFYDQEYHALVFGFEDVQDLEYLVNKSQGYLIFNFVKKFLKPKVPLKVAEVGCGVGHNLRIFREEAAKMGNAVEAFGCEYSGPSVAYGREKLGLTLFQGGIEALREAGTRFDVLILSHVLEHFADPRQELARIADLLTDNGLVYVEIPGVMEIHHKPEYQCDYLKYSVCAHMFNFSLGTLQNLMEGCGFELMAGNETVRSVFAPNRDVKSEPRNHYQRTLAYLNVLEDQRHLFNEHCQSRNQLTALQGLVNSLQGSLNQAIETEKYTSLRDEEMRAEFEALVKIVEEIRTEKADLTRHHREETARLNESLLEMAKAKGGHKGRLAVIEGELEDLRRDKAAAEQTQREEVARLNHTIQGMTEAEAAHRERLALLEAELEEVRRAKEVLEETHRAEVARLHHTIQGMAETEAAHRERLALLEAELEEVRLAREVLEETHRAEIGRLSSAVEDLRGEKAGAEVAHRQDMERLSEANRRLQAERDKVDGELDQLLQTLRTR